MLRIARLSPKSSEAGLQLVCRPTRATHLADGETFTYAMSHALWHLVGLTALGALLTWGFVRAPEKRGPDPAVAGDPPPAELRHHAHHRRFHL